MKRWLIILFVSLVAFAASLWLWASRGSGTGPQPNPKEIVSYQDSMHPWVKSDRPGTCSICGMRLTPIFEDKSPASKSTALITLSREAVTVANVAVEPVLRRDVHRTIRVAGVFEAQESRSAVVSAPAAGRVDFITVDHPGTEIQQGETLVRLFSPDLAQRSRFLRVSTSNQPASSTNGMRITPLQDRVGTMLTTMNESPAPATGGYRLDLFMADLTAPISGIVSERTVTLGQYIMEGQKLATIIDPSVLWFRFDAFDRQLHWIVPGQQIEIRNESSPEQAWIGTVALVEPVSNDLRGFAKVRAVVTNTPAHSDLGTSVALRPGMVGEGRILVVFPDVLTVSKSAVVYPGSSAWVYVERNPRSYERRRIRLGREGDDGWEVLLGLREGEQVVTTGNLLVDAQATLENCDEPHSIVVGDEVPMLESDAAVKNRPRVGDPTADPYCSVRIGSIGTGRKPD